MAAAQPEVIDKRAGSGPQPRVALGSEERRRRLTYLMLLRVGVVSLLLVLTFISQLTASVNQLVSTRLIFFLALIASTYVLTIVFALWLKRAQHPGRLAGAQIAFDLLVTTALVSLTGGVESGFSFMFLIIVVAGSFVLDVSALWLGVAAVLLEGGVMALCQVEPSLGPPPPLRDALRTLSYNAVSFVATGALAARLAVELRRASEREVISGLKLRNLTALHEDVIRCLTSGLVTVVDGRVATFNAAAQAMLGLDVDRAVGQPVSEVLPWLAALSDGAGDGPARRNEAEHRRPDGAVVPLGVSVSPLFDASGARLGDIVNFQDLTELRRMREQIARSERLAAIGRLSAGIAHEIRNPLAAISGSVELLAQTAARDDETKQLMGIVLSEIGRLDALITDLLAFARPRAPDKQALDLGSMVSEVVTVLGHDKELGRTLDVERAEGVWVDADPNQLRQVVWNLVRNAAEASPPQAHIVIEVGNVAAGGRAARARMVVRDRGPGIPPEQRARVFEPFFSTKEHGTGLGLALVHRIVEDHGGAIEIETPADGIGTAMVVTLPARPGGGEDVAAASI